jgi:hypothetical protein
MLRCDTNFLVGVQIVFDWKNNPISTTITCKIPNNAALKHIMRIRTGDASFATVNGADARPKYG